MPFNDGDPGAIIHATIGIATADGGLAAARAVAAIIDNVIHCVAASAPGADAEVTANVITNAITNYATAVKEEPGLSIDTIYAQAQNSVPASSREGLSKGLPKALENVGHALARDETWLSISNLAPDIVYAVAQVTGSLAKLSKFGRVRTIAKVWSNVADEAVAILSNGVVRGNPPARPFPNRAGGECSGGERPAANDLAATVLAMIF
jgi:hypothetical protein